MFLVFGSVIHACFDIRDFGPVLWRLCSFFWPMLEEPGLSVASFFQTVLPPLFPPHSPPVRCQ